MKKRPLYFIVVLTILGITVGYALLSANLKINGTTSLGNINYLVVFRNLRLSGNNVHESDTAYIHPDDETKMTFDLTLDKPSDYFEIDFDMVNVGSLLAKISNISLEISNEEDNFISCELFDANGDEIKNGDIISFLGLRTKSAKLFIEYYIPYDATLEDLERTGQTYTISLSIDFEYYNYITDEVVNPLIPHEDDIEFNGERVVMIHAADYSKNATYKMTLLDYLLNDGNEPERVYTYIRSSNDDGVNIIFNGMCWKKISAVAYPSYGGGGAMAESMSKGASSKEGSKSGSNISYDEVAVKLLYNGLPTEDNKCLATGTETFIGVSPYSSEESYDYETSIVKDIIEGWVSDNIPYYYLENSEFCNSNKYTPYNPDTKCDDEDILDMWSGLDYPAGLLTVDEANIHGLTMNPSTNSLIGVNAPYWTMSGTSTNSIWAIGASNNLDNTRLYSELLGIRPVVFFDGNLLNYESEITVANSDDLSWDEYNALAGTKEHPYIYTITSGYSPK